ncbi:hypothetical protein Ga0061065_1169 [Marinomonas fungiae]|uniref:Uncharacterized protein n=1 Tax=Marinomonas fungiae TaxID=1137284 RepID=A0A0K6IT03_9GAMM|nr:hypothetical protein Ga0061065_1169 [Marinomonas fungiae]
MEFAHVVLLVLAVAFIIKLGYLWYRKHHQHDTHRSHHDS